MKKCPCCNNEFDDDDSFCDDCSHGMRYVLTYLSPDEDRDNNVLKKTGPKVQALRRFLSEESRTTVPISVASVVLVIIERGGDFEKPN